MELTRGITHILSVVKSGSKDIIYLFIEDCEAIKNQFGGFSNFIDFIEKESNTIHVDIEAFSLISHENHPITIRFLNGSEIELRLIQWI